MNPGSGNRLHPNWDGQRKGVSMLKVRDLVEARLYESEEQAVQDALRHLLRARPGLRVQLAIHRYQTEEISLAKAASLAGVSWAQMREILLERGIQPRLGPETLEEGEREVQALRDYFQAPIATGAHLAPAVASTTVSHRL
jgi:predicted HTH domain antitoxin